MCVQQEGFAIFYQSIGIFKVGTAFSNGFDLGSAKHQSGFEFIEQEVAEPGGAVDGRITLSRRDRFAGFGLGRGRPTGLMSGVWGALRHRARKPSCYSIPADCPSPARLGARRPRLRLQAGAAADAIIDRNSGKKHRRNCDEDCLQQNRGLPPASESRSEALRKEIYPSQQRSRWQFGAQ